MTRYSIKDLESLSGIKAHTIRIWEKRYQLLDPERSDTNIRFYSNEDVKRILNVAMLVKNGYKISNVASFDAAKLQYEVLRQNRNLSDPEKNIDRLILHTVNLDLMGFELLISKIIEENGFPKVIQNVVFPFFERIGVLWQAGSIFVTHEHFVSNLVRKHLIVETARANNLSSDKSMLFFLPEDEMHELGLLFLNYLAANAGYRCIYLGQNVPFDDLSQLLKNHPFDMIATSFIYAIEKEALEHYLISLSRIYKNKIIISGRQIGINRPSVPSNVVVVKNAGEFIKRITK